MKYRYSAIIVLLLAFTSVRAQVDIEVTVENQYVQGTDFYFDVYLKTILSTASDLYLHTADFVFTFNNANFSNPVFSKVANPSPPQGYIQNGYCNFVSTSYADPNSASAQGAVQMLYYSSTSVSLIAGKLVVNLNGPSPGNQTAFDNGIARINGAISTHRLGRFKVSGINNPNGNMNLQWVSSQFGLTTGVFSMQNSAPFTSSAVNILTLTPPQSVLLPVDLVSFDARLAPGGVQLDWVTASEINMRAYEIQREDRNGWITIGKVDARGEQSTTSYTFLDINPAKGRNYYRLRMVGYDDDISYSPIKDVFWNGTLHQGQDGLTIYPNPASEIVNIQLDNPVAGGILTLYAMNGTTVTTKVLRDESEHIITVPVDHLPEGIYTLSFLGDGKQWSQRILKN